MLIILCVRLSIGLWTMKIKIKRSIYSSYSTGFQSLCLSFSATFGLSEVLRTPGIDSDTTVHSIPPEWCWWKFKSNWSHGQWLAYSFPCMMLREASFEELVYNGTIYFPKTCGRQSYWIQQSVRKVWGIYNFSNNVLIMMGSENQEGVLELSPEWTVK